MDGPKGRGEDITLWLAVTSIVAYSETNYYSSFKRFLDFYCIWLHIFVFLWHSVCTKIASSGGDTADCQLYIPQKTHRPIWQTKLACSCGSGLSRVDRPGVHMEDCPSTWTELGRRKPYLVSEGRVLTPGCLWRRRMPFWHPACLLSQAQRHSSSKKALKEEWTQEQQQQFGQKGLQHPKKSVCSQG